MEIVELLDASMHKIFNAIHKINIPFPEELKQLSNQDKKIVMSIYMLSQSNEVITATLLANHYGVTMPAIMHRLTSLEKHGLIFKESDPSDKRIKYIKLTKKIYDQCDQIHIASRQVLNSFTNYLGEEDTLLLTRLLTRIASYLERKED